MSHTQLLVSHCQTHGLRITDMYIGIDTPQYASHGVRERTQELAAYALDAESFHENDPHHRAYTDSEIGSNRRAGLVSPGQYGSIGRRSLDSYATDAIEEESEPTSTPETVRGETQDESAQSYFDYPVQPQNDARDRGKPSTSSLPQVFVEDAQDSQNTERTPLLPKSRTPGKDSQRQLSRSTSSQLTLPVKESFVRSRDHVVHFWHTLSNPKTYTKEAALSGAMSSVQVLSAVFLGLLLNVLDALSYGYILFPLGVPMFSKTGPDGISIFFLSCIVSQLCYSLGLSKFKGGVGSEMIEVVPFFHNMAYAIMDRMEGKSDESIMATVIVSYCLSSVVTGLIFLGLGAFKLGSLVSFFPRHILIGCIGGVGFFLFVTGIEVSARLEGNLNYNFATLQKLFSKDTAALWLLPLALAVIILVLRRYFKSPFILPAFFIAVFSIFYIVVKGILRLDLHTVRTHGWIFEQPEAGVPFYRFYSYFSKSFYRYLSFLSRRRVD